MDALALGAEEGRGKAAKSLGLLPSELSRGYPNGATQYRKTVLPSITPDPREASGGTETSKYPEEKKSTEIPLVVANERGRAQISWT